MVVDQLTAWCILDAFVALLWHYTIWIGLSNLEAHHGFTARQTHVPTKFLLYVYFFLFWYVWLDPVFDSDCLKKYFSHVLATKTFVFGTSESLPCVTEPWPSPCWASRVLSCQTLATTRALFQTRISSEIFKSSYKRNTVVIFLISDTPFKPYVELHG